MDRIIDNDAREPDGSVDRDPERYALDAPRAYEIATLRERIDAASQDHPTFSEFLDRLERQGIRTVPSFQKSGRLNGMSYEYNGGRYRGSDLGRGYTASGLQKS